MSAGKLRGLLADPLIHFLVLGIALFGLYSAVSPGESEDSTAAIEITPSDIDLMRADWEKQRRRLPTADELQRLIDERVREEVFYREALAMGLDQGDPAIRRQMAEKILFMLRDLEAGAEPKEAELGAYLAANAERYELPASVSFRHVFFDSALRATPAEDASDALADAVGGGNAPVGDPFDLGDAFADVTPDEAKRLLGAEFASRLFALASGAWHGPIESDYGLHLVRIVARQDARSPRLGEVRERVIEDLMAERREATAENFFHEARRRYDIVVADPRQVKLASE